VVRDKRLTYEYYCTVLYWPLQRGSRKRIDSGGCALCRWLFRSCIGVFPACPLTTTADHLLTNQQEKDLMFGVLYKSLSSYSSINNREREREREKERPTLLLCVSCWVGASALAEGSATRGRSGPLLSRQNFGLSLLERRVSLAFLCRTVLAVLPGS